MIVRWPWLGLAIVLLGCPPLLSAELRRVVGSMRRNASVNVTALVRPWQNWLDFVRACAGTAILTQIAITPDSIKDPRPVALLAQSAVLAVALLPQILRWDNKAPRPEQRLQVITPVFYMSGLTLALSGILSGAFGVTVGWFCAFGAKNPTYQLPVMAVALAAAGYILGPSLALYCNLALIALPFVPAFAFRKRMAFVGTEVRLPLKATKSGTIYGA